MTFSEWDTLTSIRDYLKYVKILAGAQFENYANNKENDKAIIFQGLRDRLNAEVETIESYIKTESRDVSQITDKYTKEDKE